MFGFRNHRKCIMNMVGEKGTDNVEKSHNHIVEEFAKDYAKRNNVSVVSVFENGKFTRNIVVKD